VQTEDWVDRLFLWVVTHVPPRGIALLAGLLYFGLGLALPIGLAVPTPWLVSLNFMGTVLAGSLLLFWFIVQLEARDRRKLLEWTGDLRLLDGEEFEWLVGEVFRREGWQVTERGRQDAPDGNVDLELRRGTERRLVQCKRWDPRWVKVDQIRLFLGILAREKLAPSAGVFVTLSRFNQHAVQEAKTAGLELIDGADLYRRVERVRTPVACDVCGQPMLLDHNAHGWWFRCVTPGCMGKRALDRDPGRAVALLTEQKG